MSPDGGVGLHDVAAGRDVRSESHVHHHYGGAPGDPAPPPVVRFGLVPPTAHFAGRDDLLARLAGTPGSDAARPVVHVLCGLGGVGKTHLAARYATTNLHRFAVVAWIRAEQDPTIDLAALADRLVTISPSLRPEERARRAVEHLAASDRPWLLVFDNAEHAEALRPLLPPSGPGQVIVTTRSPELRSLGTLVRVEEFDLRTAVAYLRERAPGAGDAATARDLAEALGLLPLALGHAGAYCASGTTFADYLEFLAGLPARELFITDPQASHERTVASTWQPSIDAAGRLCPLARTVLDVAAYLAPDDIPVGLLGPLADEPDTVRGRKQLADARNALFRYSLIEGDGDAFAVHRLLQKVVRDDHTAGGGVAVARPGAPAEPTGDRPGRAPAARAVALLDAALTGDPSDPAAWPTYRRLRPHVARTLATATDLDGPSRATQVAVANRTCRCLLRAEGPAPALAAATTAAAHAAHHLGADHPLTLDADHSLANALRGAGRTGEAVRLGEQVLARQERLLGPDHPQTLWTRHNLATSLRTAGRADEAVSALEQVLADRLRTLGPDHPDTLTARQDLASSHRFVGRVAEAIAMMEEILTDRMRILGPDHPQTLSTRSFLGVALRHGQIDRSVTMLESVLADRRRVLGADHPGTLATGHSLAVSYHGAGRTDEARALAARVLADRARVLGPDHPHTADTRAQLARWTDGTSAGGDAGS